MACAAANADSHAVRACIHAEWRSEGTMPASNICCKLATCRHIASHVRTANLSVRTCAVTQTVEVDAATLSCSLVTAALLDAPAGTVVATDVCCPLCKVAADDTALMAAWAWLSGLVGSLGT